MRDFSGKNGVKTLNNPYGISKITPSHWPRKILKYNGKLIFDIVLWWSKRSKENFKWNRDILISNMISESISDFGKWSNWKYANYANWRIFSLTTSQNWFQNRGGLINKLIQSWHFSPSLSCSSYYYKSFGKKICLLAPK